MINQELIIIIVNSMVSSFRRIQDTSPANVHKYSSMKNYSAPNSNHNVIHHKHREQLRGDSPILMLSGHTSKLFRIELHASLQDNSHRKTTTNMHNPQSIILDGRPTTIHPYTVPKAEAMGC